jgi:predicted alpha/beta-hydrolase family hydrolase
LVAGKLLTAHPHQDYMKPEPVTIDLDPETDAKSVSGLLTRPKTTARACLVLAHGAGAGMEHPFMAQVAGGLADRQIATLRYQFPYMEHRQKRPDTPKVAHAAVRAAVAAAAAICRGVPLFAGGKSFGARMTSQSQAVATLEPVRGLVFLGFPLHPPKQPGMQRADHLEEVRVPMLFLQGTRDELADLALLRPIVKKLGKLATLTIVEHADHSFHVLKRSGRTDTEVMNHVLDEAAGWMIANA